MSTESAPNTIFINGEMIILSEVRIIGRVIEKSPMYMTDKHCANSGIDPDREGDVFVVKIVYESGHVKNIVFSEKETALESHKKLTDAHNDYFICQGKHF